MKLTNIRIERKRSYLTLKILNGAPASFLNLTNQNAKCRPLLFFLDLASICCYFPRNSNSVGFGIKAESRMHKKIKFKKVSTLEMQNGALNSF